MEVGLFGRLYDITASTTAGRRHENQDRFAWVAVSSGKRMMETADGMLAHAEVGGPDMLMAAVCDGMGGMRDGAKAAGIVCDGLVDWASDADFGDSGEAVESLRRTLRDLDGRVADGCRGGGTTLSMVLAFDDVWTSVHIGDSRCYFVREGSTTRTVDDSPVEEMFRNGLITEDGMNTHPMSHLLSLYMGGGHPERATIAEIQDGWHRLALCSDGAFGYMTVAEFGRLVRDAPDAGSVVEGSYRRDSRDNITVLAIDRVRTP